VVKRSFTLVPGENGTAWFHYLLAPLYSMGLIHATKKRKIVSWSVTTGVAVIVAAVKRLPYPYRNIVDAGVSFCPLCCFVWVSSFSFVAERQEPLLLTGLCRLSLNLLAGCGGPFVGEPEHSHLVREIIHHRVASCYQRCPSREHHEDCLATATTT